MATELIAKSFRTLVGAHSPNSGAPGVYVLDSNDTTRFFGLFVLADGDPESVKFACDYLKNRFAPYSDVYCRREITKPQAFLKGLTVELIREMTSAGLKAPTAPEQALAIVLTISGVVYVARCNNAPVLYMKDRKFRQVFASGQSSEGVETAAIQAAEGDRILLCSESIHKRLTRLEMRNIVQAENELELACSKIATLANRYEETAGARVVLIGLRRILTREKSLFTKKNALIVASLIVFVMMLFTGSDILKLVRAHKFHISLPKPSMLMGKRQTGQPRAMKVLATYTGLSVPYDVSFGDNGRLYVVDDRSEKVLRFDPETSEAAEIGQGVQLQFPTAVERDGGQLFVADFSRQVSKVYRLDLEGNLLGAVPGQGERVALSNPKAIAADGAGNIYLCDRGNDRVLKFSRDGLMLREIRMPQGMSQPNGIAVAKNGDVYVSLKESNGVARITGDDTVEPFPLYAGEGQSPVSLDKPAGIAVDAEGYVYVADNGNRRILMADPKGKVTDILDAQRLKDLETTEPMSVRLGPDEKTLFITGSNQRNYSVVNERQCKGVIWKIGI